MNPCSDRTTDAQAAGEEAKRPTGSQVCSLVHHFLAGFMEDAAAVTSASSA
jgi:hypothetical protein